MTRLVLGEMRFWDKVDLLSDAPCWRWLAAANDGYGAFAVNGIHPEPAHRVSYMMQHGRIPAGLHLDHLCRNHWCVNPDHLEPVTNQENVRRGVRIGHDHPNAPTTCKRGHDWNLFPPQVNIDKRTGLPRRQCKECGRIRNKERYWREKAAR